MSQPERKPIRHLGLKLFAATLLTTALVFAWSSSNHKTDPATQETWVDDSGQLHVLGLTLGKTVLREAEVALKSRSDIALYIYPEEHPEAGLKLEAFFPAIADHCKVILELDSDEETVKMIQQRSTLPHLYPNKVARMNLHPEDLAIVQQLTVKSLTLIPSIAIPVALIGTVAGIWMLGFSINILTLLVLVLATGLVVDDAIVVLENIQRRHAQCIGSRAAAVLGTRQVFFAVVTTSIVLVSVFVPIAFLPSTSGPLSREFRFLPSLPVAIHTVFSL